MNHQLFLTEFKMFYLEMYFSLYKMNIDVEETFVVVWYNEI